MRVALVNSNRYLEPPVIPLGIEYLAHYLDREGHEIKIIDLAFAARPEDALCGELDDFGPQVIGFSLRNTDTCLYPDTVFFLDDAAALISRCRQTYDAKMVIGGSALLAGPGEVAEYTGCDHAIFGPGEIAFPMLINMIEEGADPPRMWNGWEFGLDPHEIPARGRWLDYSPYLRERGLAGFETQLGCRGKCGFCIEAGLPWKQRSPGTVAEELRALTEAGCRELHLCDCEFNQDLAACKSLLRTIIREALDTSWALYMKPIPHDGELFQLLAETGAHAITLSVDSRSLSSEEYSFEDLAGFIDLTSAHGIKLAVDLLVGLPDDGLSQIRGVIDFFKRVRPDTVGVNTWIRLYKYTTLGKSLRAKPPMSGIIKGEDPDFLKPVFYNWLDTDTCLSLIEDDPLFRIEGLERRSNYERL